MEDKGLYGLVPFPERPFPVKVVVASVKERSGPDNRKRPRNENRFACGMLHRTGNSLYPPRNK